MNDNLKTCECRYFHNGKWWAVEITAQDDGDAEARVCKFGNLQLCGEVGMHLHSKTPHWFARCLVWFLDRFRA